MIQAIVAHQTVDIETPLPQADAINPWGYQAAQLKKRFPGSQAPSEPVRFVKQELDSERDKLIFAENLSLDY